MRLRLTPFMRRTLEQLGIESAERAPLFRAMMANTVVPTIVRAGYKDNVIPGEASVVLDGRTLPGETAESLLGELREIVGPEPAFEVLKCAPPAEGSADTPLFRLIAHHVEMADPGARAIAWMLPGATDSKFYAQLGATCYGFAPVRIGPRMPYGALYHGNDERIPGRWLSVGAAALRGSGTEFSGPALRAGVQLAWRPPILASFNIGSLAISKIPRGAGVRRAAPPRFAPARSAG